MLPLPTTVLEAYSGKATPDQIFHYQQLVRSLNWASTLTRPDLSRTTSKLAEFQQNPSKSHLNAANQALRYLISTKSKGILYLGQLRPDLKVFSSYSDASFTDDIATRHSSQGFIFFLFRGLIKWTATK